MVDLPIKHGPKMKPTRHWDRLRANLLRAIDRAGHSAPPLRFYFRKWLTCDGEPLAGYAYFTGKTGAVWISTSACGTGAFLCDTLIHEVAHVLANMSETDNHPHMHSDLWGLIYARLYREFIDYEEEGPRA